MYSAVVNGSRTADQLQFRWHISRRGYFDEGPQVIEGRKLLETIRRVLVIERTQEDLPYVPTSCPVDRLLTCNYNDPRYRLPPMSVRHKYQPGASRLRWPAGPVRRVPPKRLADQDAFALVTRIKGVV